MFTPHWRQLLPRMTVLRRSFDKTDIHLSVIALSRNTDGVIYECKWQRMGQNISYDLLGRENHHRSHEVISWHDILPDSNALQIFYLTEISLHDCNPTQSTHARAPKALIINRYVRGKLTVWEKNCLYCNAHVQAMLTVTLTSRRPHGTAGSPGKNIWPRSNEISAKPLLVNFPNTLKVNGLCSSAARAFSVKTQSLIKSLPWAECERNCSVEKPKVIRLAAPNCTSLYALCSFTTTPVTG